MILGLLDTWNIVQTIWLKTRLLYGNNDALFEITSAHTFEAFLNDSCLFWNNFPVSLSVVLALFTYTDTSSNNKNVFPF